MSGYAHRPDCECQECWPIVYASPPRQRFVSVDPASPSGDFSVGIDYQRMPDGKIKMLAVSIDPVRPPTRPARDDWMPSDLMGPRR